MKSCRLDNSNPDLGELALIGPCVGLGYYNDPERTAMSFVQNPKSHFNQLMYKTGDIVQKHQTDTCILRAGLITRSNIWDTE